MMLTTAYNWRKDLDDDGKIGTYWYEFKKMIR